MVHSPLTNGVQLTSDSSSRNGVKVDRFILHHAATTSLAAILALFQPGGRTVSANYAMGNDGTLILAVDETRRAWTSSSAQWDGRAITIEVANSSTGGSWPVSDATFDKLARLIADVATRYNFPINDNTLLTHQELYRRYGASYPTACPGDMQRRKAELINKANYYKAFPSTPAGGGGTIIEETEVATHKTFQNPTDFYVRPGWQRFPWQNSPREENIATGTGVGLYDILLNFYLTEFPAGSQVEGRLVLQNAASGYESKGYSFTIDGSAAGSVKAAIPARVNVPGGSRLFLELRTSKGVDPRLDLWGADIAVLKVG